MSADHLPAHRSLSSGVAGPRLLVLGGVHGDEYEPMEAVRRLGTTLAAASFAGSVTLVPVANPSAFENGTREGADGIDMARSFPGDPAGSATPRAAHAVSALMHGADALVDLHTGGRVLRVLPMAGYMLHADSTVLECQRRMARAFGLGVIWGTSAGLPGRSLSAARDLGIPAIYVEHGGGGGCDRGGVEACVAGCLGVMRELGMLDAAAARVLGAAAASPVPLVVEDPREGSGQMQTSHPAPRAGFFTSAVAPGAVIRAGDLVGTVCGPLGEDRVDVSAACTGHVLAVRVVPAVRVGDALAVIVETDPPGGRLEGAAR